jgi:hypothetical protein
MLKVELPMRPSDLKFRFGRNEYDAPLDEKR